MQHQAAQTWAERAQAELGAAQRFRDLHLKLQRVEAHPQITHLVAQAEQEEDQHAFLCAQMARKLGHPTGFAHIPGSVELMHHWEDRPDERERVLLDVVLMSCITESLNASLLNTIYAHTPRNEASELIHRILKDEVKHAQIGWAYLNQESTLRDCSFIAHYLVDMLDIAIKDEVFLPVVDHEQETLYEYGVMPLHHRLTQLSDTLTQVICPGFEHVGINTSAINAWLSSRLKQHHRS